MILSDLDYIFKPQLDDNEEKLYYMLIDGNYSLVERYDTYKMAELIYCLDNFIFDGYISGKMPKFIKQGEQI